ncbi:MAG: type II secretion system ATPase GspE [Gammaproteobacteria bacterium]
MHVLPYAFSKRYGVLIQEENDHVVMKCRRDTPLEILLEVRRALETPCQLIRMDLSDFDHLLEQFYHRQAQAGLEARVEQALDLEVVAHELQTVEDLLDTEQEAPIIRLINALIAQALKEKASDIHVETYKDDLVFRMRLDGVLKTKMRLPVKLAPLIISRIKIMAKLNIAEKRLPQDGRIALQIGGRQVDVRVSTLPSSHGERIVLRLLDKESVALKLDSLGLSEYDLNLMKQLKQKPHGIILVTGPTGAGKTTTLYAFLNELNDHSRNILTVEDPVEYELPGIGQSQVNAKIGMTFARGLRAILRQDPDIVMVGEIRDLETADIAIQASLTGHLMLSTLHTNTAVGAITRLRDMGVASYLIASTLEAVIAQRLVRRLCLECKKAVEADAVYKKCLHRPVNEPLQVFTAVGCEACDHTGYKGRMAIYEIVLMDDTLKQMIHEDAPENDIKAYAHTIYPSIKEAGIRRVIEGETTLEEVIRVTDLSS